MSTQTRLKARFGLDNNGLTLVNVAEPVDAQDASTKNFSSNASNLVSGTLDAARLPSFSGDVSSTSGTSVLTLANSGVIADTYTSVTVDAKGRVTTGSKPTTLDGYGITDALSSSLLGVANGIATLDANGVIDASQVPSDVLVYTNLSSFPAVGEFEKIYISQATNNLYRWDGSTYIVLTGGSGADINLDAGSASSVYTGISSNLDCGGV